MSTSRLKEITQAAIQPFTEIKDLFKHPYSCYMLAAIQYNNAMFHIFSGPLFANVQGYVYIDLIIWGISPLIYLLFRPTLYKIIKPDLETQSIAEINETKKLIRKIQTHRKHLNFIHKRRLCSLIFFSFAIFVSFLFMNYSQTFNWNYFTRIINMDIGYLIFDFACRSMQLIVEIQEDQQIQEKYNRCQTQFQLNQMRQTSLKVEKCRIYCKFKNFTMFLSYSVIFLLFTNGFNVNFRYSGQEVLALTSIFSCIVTFIIPMLYFFYFKTKYFQKWNFFNNFTQQTPYKAIGDEEDKPQNVLQIIDEMQDEQNFKTQEEIQNQLRKIKRIICRQNKPCSPPTHRSDSNDASKGFWQTVKLSMQSGLKWPICLFILAYFSMIINVSYLALWIMQALKQQVNYIQYNQTLLISSVFFMVSSGLFGIASRINLNYPFEIDRRLFSKQGSDSMQDESIQWGYVINKGFMLILGIVLLCSFTLVSNNIYMYILSTIGFGFHLALLNFVYFRVEKIIQQLEIDIDLQILSLYLETIAYLGVPVVITLTQTTKFTYAIYGWISSLSMIFTALLM